MTDPVQRLQAARFAIESDPMSMEEIKAKIASLYHASGALLDALPTMLQSAKADGWDEGYRAEADFISTGRSWTNPYRVAAAGELARETREQGFE